jgi:RNA polymerase sigma factor (sigma-70 family)
VAPHRDTTVLDGLVDDIDAGFAAFVRAHSGPVYSTALRLSGSRAEADDLAQETFVRAYRSLRRFDAERVRALESRPWLLTITLNLWRNRLRHTARRPRETRGPLDVADTRPGPEETAEEGEASRALVVLLGQLPEHQRVPVVLRHVVGLSYAEIASTVHCPVGTAKANVARGLERLRVLACAPAAPARRSSGARRPRQLVHDKEAR